jgi:hypothetical protein
MPILNKYEIGVKHSDNNIYFTGLSCLAVSRDDAITEYINHTHDDIDRKLIVANKIE